MWAVFEQQVKAAKTLAAGFILTAYFLACEIQHCLQIDRENIEKGVAAKMTVTTVNDLI